MMARASEGDEQRAEVPEARRVEFHDHGAVQLLIDPETGAIVDANQAAATFYGYTIEELRQRTVIDLNQLPVELIQRELHRAAAQTRTSFVFKHRLRSGEVRDVQVQTGPYREGERELLLSIICDITEHRRLAEYMVHAQRMEAMGMLAGGVAHDLNNLLTALGMVTTLLGGRTTSAPEVGELQELVQRGSALTRQMLAFCRRQAPRAVVLDVIEVLRGIEPMIRRLLPSTITLELEVPSAPVRMVGDPVQVEQVVLNLALNARDAMPQGGQLRIALESEVTPGKLQLRVSDNGKGISAPQRAHLFEPFYTTKPAGQGTGLGLVMVRELIHQHGGEVEVSSEENRGTTFTVSLPLAGTFLEVPLPEEEGPSSEEGRGERVLLVDDDSILRGTVARLLRRRGYEVVDVGEAAQAEQAFRRGEFDVLVTDVALPRVNGCELAARLAEERPELRVLYTSGHADAYATLGLLGAGESFLAKPFSAEALLRALRGVLAQPPRHPPSSGR